jgi:hypothetical protein
MGSYLFECPTDRTDPMIFFLFHHGKGPVDRVPRDVRMLHGNLPVDGIGIGMPPEFSTARRIATRCGVILVPCSRRIFSASSGFIGIFTI